MGAFATALAPVLALIVVGLGLRRAAFLPEATWPGIEKLTYFILFPALLVRTLGSQSLEGVPWPGMMLAVFGTVVIATAAMFLWYRVRPGQNGPTFSSVFQGGIRFNTYIALAVGQAFFGPEGLALAAVAAGLMIVLVNLLCVFVLIRFGNSMHTGATPYVREVAGNPLVLSCVFGGVLGLSGIGLPGLTDDVLEIVGRAALPLGLLAVGAALRPEAVFRHVRSIAISSIVQYALKPASALLLTSVAGLSGVAAAVVLITMMVPTAPSAYILARQLGGDAETMASIITFQTLLAFFVMPLLAVITIR